MGQAGVFSIGVQLLLIFMAVSHTASLAVMSIDLGNEFMKIGLVKPGVPMEIVLNTESSRKTSMVVAMRQGGDREFANAAMNTATRFPSSAYIYLRELLAKNTSNPVVQQFYKRFPYYKMEDDTERATITFEHPDGTKYSVEELLAMVMESAKRYASVFAEQKVSDAVILCPAHFNQAERRALKRSAELAGIKVLQLMNNHAAVALNYGIFRRKEFNSTAQNYMFFDMGSTSTTVSIVSYQVVKMKVGSVVETNPQVTVRGVGFDRSLGALEITIRLRDHLAKQFNGVKKSANDVLKNPRSMAKLHKEAERVKKILSANADTYAQVENLMDDEDFKVKVTRKELESMSADIFERIAAPVQQALQGSEITMAEINEVILMGGATRIPKVQEMLLKTVRRKELGKSINTDEAAALGAVYQAAYLSTGFRVKTFAVKDANVYPIQVQFERAVMDEDGTDTTRSVKRTLFSRFNPYPQKKVMTFNKHTDDFNFDVNYGDISFLSSFDHQAFGKESLSMVELEGVKEQLDKHVDNFTESKGVKAHFVMDESGLLLLDNVEIVFERKPNPASEETTFSKLSSTISNFFGSSSSETSEEKDSSEGTDEKVASDSSDSEHRDDPSEDKKVEDVEKDNSNINKEEDNEQPSAEKAKEKEADGSSGEASEQTNTTADTKLDTKDNATASNATKAETKPVTIKRSISSKIKVLDSQQPDSEHIKASREMLIELTKKDEEKMKLAAVKNNLESFSYEVKNKLYEEEFELCSTEEEREEIREKLTLIIDWYDESPFDTPLKDFEDKLAEAKKLVKFLYERVAGHRDRPQAMDALKSTLNHTKYMLASMKNYSLIAPDGDGPFTQVELATLEKIYNESKEWMETMKAEQKGKLPTETPAFNKEDVAIKIAALDREIKYLLNKAKLWTPKKPPTLNNSTKSNTTKTKNRNATSPDSPEGDAGYEKTIDIPEPEEAQSKPLEEPPTEDEPASSEAEKSPRHEPVEPVETDEEETLQLDDVSSNSEDHHKEL
ncbi:hypoxia up-regulated protein 1-like [Watersipora subatra]|uniref:hypoxia up-regulated protein 1-like n=1 Tax=Watersipora subatra TaxID=2589382 RepID=UPI00355AF88E